MFAIQLISVVQWAIQWAFSSIYLQNGNLINHLPGGLQDCSNPPSCCAFWSVMWWWCLGDEHTSVGEMWPALTKCWLDWIWTPGVWHNIVGNLWKQKVCSAHFLKVVTKHISSDQLKFPHGQYVVSRSRSHGPNLHNGISVVMQQLCTSELHSIFQILMACCLKK